MPIIFENNRGRVSAVTDRGAAGIIQLAHIPEIDGDSPNESLTYESHSTIITAIGMSTSCNQQFLHAVGGDVYIYVFGDRIGRLELKGISFSQRCSGREGPREVEEPHGFERLYEWYQRNRIARRRKPVRVILGRSLAIDGFLTSLVQTGEDPETRAVRFTLQLSLLGQENV
jgi:hypothetical protein